MKKNGLYTTTLLVLSAFAFLLILSTAPVTAAPQVACTAIANGNWNSAGTWDCGHIPLPVDTVTVKNNAIITVNTITATAASVQLGVNGGSNSGSGQLTFTSGSVLTVTGAVTFGNTPRTGSVVMTAGGKLVANSFVVSALGTWTPGTGTVEFAAVNTIPAGFTTFNNLNVNGGTTTLAVNTTVNGNLNIISGIFNLATFNTTVTGTTTNSGTIRANRAVAATGNFAFSLAGFYNGGALGINVTTIGTLSNLLVDRIDSNAPNSADGGGGQGTQTGRYWNITATGTGFNTNLTLPHSIAINANTNVCKYVSGTTWDCARTSSTANTVTRNNVAAYSTWTVGDLVGPTAITLQDFSAQSKSSPLLPGLLALLLLALGAVTIMTRARRHV